mgnify:CR=1 FL=1
MQIRIDGEYLTKAGCPVRIYNTLAGGKYTVHGAYQASNDTWSSCSWTIRGESSCFPQWNLVSVPSPDSILENIKIPIRNPYRRAEIIKALDDAGFINKKAYNGRT